MSNPQLLFGATITAAFAAVAFIGKVLYTHLTNQDKHALKDSLVSQDICNATTKRFEEKIGDLKTQSTEGFARVDNRLNTIEQLIRQNNRG
ncbi:MAG: hypothetical protein ACYS1A_20115 [Planctomycetota bacterium]|jgi:hypothetical protein